MRTHLYSAVLVIAAALLLGGVFLLGGSVGTVEVAWMVTLWGVASRMGTLVLVVGAPIAFLYWLATVNAGSVDTPEHLDRDLSVPERVEDAAYETVRGKSN